MTCEIENQQLKYYNMKDETPKAPMATITVGTGADARTLPCYPTMGAMLRFQRLTGREVTEINPGSLSDLCTYLYCCVVSASRRERKELNMELMEFADSITPEAMQRWQQQLEAGAADEPSATAGAEKKSRRRQPQS